MHVDSGATHFWQYLAQGRKRWTFFPYELEAAELLLYLDHVSGASALDVVQWMKSAAAPAVTAASDGAATAPAAAEDSLERRFPLFREAFDRRIDVVVEAGETIFVPANLPHFVVSLESTLAVSHNYVDSSNLLDFISETRTQYVRHAELDRLEALALSGAIRVGPDPKPIPWASFEALPDCTPTAATGTY